MAVLPCSSSDYEKLTPEERGVRDFEKTYIAASIIEEMERPEFKSKIFSPYFSPGMTPAADLIVKTDIQKSDGVRQVLDVEVDRANGTKVWDKTFRLDSQKTLHDLYLEIANGVADTKQQPGEFANDRFQGYMGTSALATDKQAMMAAEAAVVETDSMLLPASIKVLQRADAASKIYVTWWNTAGPLVAARSSEKVSEGLGIATMVLGGVAGGLDARAGNTAGVQQSENTVEQGATTVNEASANIDQLNRTLATLANSFTYWQGKPIAVRVFGKVYTFTGSMASQQAQLRKVVQAEMAKVAG